MKLFKFWAKIGALVAVIAALVCFANKKEDQKYIIVYDEGIR